MNSCLSLTPSTFIPPFLDPSIPFLSSSLPIRLLTTNVSLIQDGHYDEKCDVFSFSMVILSALGLYTEQGLIDLYPKESVKRWIKYRLSGGRPMIPESTQERYPEQCKLVRRCWASEAQDRPSFQQIIVELEKLSEKD